MGSCKEDGKKRSKSTAKSSSFWPDAPRPAATGGPRAFKYNPDSIKGYEISVDVEAAPDSAVSFTGTMKLALDFQAGKNPRSRDARIHKLDLEVYAPGRSLDMHLDDQEFTLRDGVHSPITRKRGDGGPLDVAAMMDKPCTTLTFTEANKVELRSNTDHPFVALGGDMLNTALVLFPDLPDQPVAPGYTWTLQRNVPLARGVARVDVTYDFEYVGDSACPSGTGTCAQIALTATMQDHEIEDRGVKSKLGYDFAGKVFFDLDRGRIDESRIRMDMNVQTRGQKIAIGGVYSLRPM